MMKPAAGTAAPEAITPLIKARREVGLRAKPVNTPSTEIASVVDPPLSDISVLPNPSGSRRISRHLREDLPAIAEARGPFLQSYRTGGSENTRATSIRGMAHRLASSFLYPCARPYRSGR